MEKRDILQLENIIKNNLRGGVDFLDKFESYLEQCECEEYNYDSEDFSNLHEYSSSNSEDGFKRPESIPVIGFLL